MRSVIGALVLLIGCLCLQIASAQQLIKVSEGNSNPILIDGIFSKDEWQDAVTVRVNDSVTLYLKQLQPTPLMLTCFC